MRLLVMVIALTLVCAAATTAEDMSQQQNTVPATMGAGPESCPPPMKGAMASDDVLDGCLAAAANITVQQYTTFRGKGLSNSDIAVAAAIASTANTRIFDVVDNYATLHNWNDVACKYNITLASIGTWQNVIGMDNNAYNKAFVAQRFGVSANDIQAALDQGYTWGEITMIANAANKTNQSFMTVAIQRSQGKTWDAIACACSIQVADLMNPCATCAPRPRCPVGAGPVCTKPVSPVIYTKAGNVLLTQDEAYRYYKMGNDWINVAVAANIARETGYPIETVLASLRTGQAWTLVAIDYGVPPRIAFNLACYPFPQVSIYGTDTEQRNVERINSYMTSGVFGPTPVNQTAFAKTTLTVAYFPCSWPTSECP